MVRVWRDEAARLRRPLHHRLRPARRPAGAGSVCLPDLPPEEAWRRAETQTIVECYNRWTHETTTFNPLRACRPVVTSSKASRAWL